ncbi:MAG: ribosome silencing factor, partial [Alphaproteobacteria bacterium]
IGDYMVIATGRSSRQILAMTDHLVRELKQHGLVGLTPEGRGQADWILIDAGDIVIHLFRPEVRAFYSLEKMWDAELIEHEQPEQPVNGPA